MAYKESFRQRVAAANMKAHADASATTNIDSQNEGDA